MTDNLAALVVEDDGFQRRAVVRMLRALGVQDVREAADGGQALALLRDSTLPHLVICDLDMPEMDGMELLRHLGRESREASVIVVSAQETPLLGSVGKMAEAYGIRLLGLIEKPVTLAALAGLIACHRASEALPGCTLDVSRTTPGRDERSMLV